MKKNKLLIILLIILTISIGCTIKNNNQTKIPSNDTINQIKTEPIEENQSNQQNLQSINIVFEETNTTIIYQLLDKFEDKFLYIDNKTSEIVEENTKSKYQKVGVKAEWAQYTQDGKIMYISLDGKLQVIDSDKKITDIISEEYSVGVWFFIHPSGRYIAYQKKLYIGNYRDEWQGIDVSVYDTKTNTETILFSNRKTNILYGWVEDELLVEFIDSKGHENINFKLIDLNGNIKEDSRFNNVRHAKTQSIPDPENKWLVFETTEGVYLLSLTDGKQIGLGKDTINPKWLPEGLYLQKNDKECLVRFNNNYPETN